MLRINIQFKEKKWAKILTEEEKLCFRDSIAMLEDCAEKMRELERAGDGNFYHGAERKL